MFLVQFGHYSETVTLGVFSTERKAVEVCETHMKNNRAGWGGSLQILSIKIDEVWHEQQPVIESWEGVEKMTPPKGPYGPQKTGIWEWKKCYDFGE